MKAIIKNRRYVGLVVSFFLVTALFSYFGSAHVLAQLKEFPLALTLGVLLLIVANVLVVTYRYWRILGHFGFDLPWALIFRASTAANVASLVIIPLFGQVAGRQAVLHAAGVSAVENALIAGYERVLVGGVSAALAFIGGGYLLGGVITEYAGLIPFDEIVPIILAAIGLTLFVSISRFEVGLFRSLLSLRNVLRLVELVLITLLSSMLMLGSFAVLFHFVAPGADWLSLYSAAAVVSFVAGLPISFGGWGPREAISVYMLGLLNVSSSKALAASVLCGILSVGAILLMAPFALKKGQVVGSVIIPGAHARQTVAGASIEGAAAWVLCFIVALLIMFQVHVPVADATINVNLADPFAVLALSVLVLNAVFKRKLPQWRIPYFNSALLIMSAVLVAGFLHGLFAFGSTSWAYGKVFGWLVLLGFLAAGYLTASYHGVRGVRRVIEVMVVVLCLILLVQVVLRSMHVQHIIEWQGFSGSIEGYSGNRNALAFQILAVAAAFIGLLPLYRGRNLRFAPGIRCEVLFGLALAWMMAGLYYTSSRTGMMVGLMLLLVVGFGRLIPAKLAFQVLGASLLLWLAILYDPLLQLINGYLFSGGGSTASSAALQAAFSDASSDSLRWGLVKQSVAVWWQAPLFGQGLGYFFMKSPDWFGLPVIVHNTLLWLLAEVGLLGAAGFLVPFVWVIRWLAVDKFNRVRNHSALLLLFCFGCMSLFHEVLYQRVFWFILGAVLATRFSSGHRRCEAERGDGLDWS